MPHVPALILLAAFLKTIISTGVPGLRGTGGGNSDAAAAPRGLSYEDESISVIEFVGTANVDKYEWSHFIGGMYSKTRVLQRPNWAKTTRCSSGAAGMCEECWGEEDCWAPCSNLRCAQTSGANSSWTRLINTIHVQCNSDDILLRYKVMDLRGGSLHFFLDGEEISSESGYAIDGLEIPMVDSSHDYKDRVAREHRAGSVTIPVGHAGGHTLDVHFVSFGSEDAGVELSELRLFMPTSFADCEDFKVCLDPISGDSEDVQKLRSSNALQLACLEEPVAMSEACAKWRGCLSSEQEVNLYVLLKAANVNSAVSGRRLSAANSSATPTNSTSSAVIDSCLNPSTADAEAWSCDCFDEMQAQCASLQVGTEVCMRAQMCSHAKVCEEWKQTAGCDDPQVVAAVESLSFARRLLERSKAPAVDGPFEAQGDLDRVLGSKTCA